MGILDTLGVKRVINAEGTVTTLGGSVLEPEVTEAMAEAAKAFVQMSKLHEKAGEYVAGLTGAEAAFITSGCSAALTLATAACMTGDDPVRAKQLPNTMGMKDEVVIQKRHRNIFDHAFTATGAKFIEVGYPGEPFAEEWEIERAISEKSVAIAYIYTHFFMQGGLPLRDIVKIAHSHDLPVIVDAANMLPPRTNLRKYTDDGADLVCFSGGKNIGGPNNTGFVAGQQELIRAVAANSSLHHYALGRPMKVSKESIAGLIAALQLYVKQDEEAKIRGWEEKTRYILDDLKNLPCVKAQRVFPDEINRPVPRARITIEEEKLGITTRELVELLRLSDPPIWVRQSQRDRGSFLIDPTCLSDGQDQIITQTLRKILKRSASA